MYNNFKNSLPSEHFYSLAWDSIFQERRRQETKWGEQNHTSLKWLAILGEEFGEACKAQLEENAINYRVELVQVAAVALAAIESIDRQSMDSV